MTAETNKQTVEAYVKVFNASDTDALCALFADDAQIFGVFGWGGLDLDMDAGQRGPRRRGGGAGPPVMARLSFQAGGLPTGLTFEVVAEIRTFTAARRPQARQQICGDECGTPELVLPHVDALVVTRCIENRTVPRHYYVAECNCGRTAAHRNAMGKKRGGGRAVDFKDAIHDLHAATAAHRRRQEQEPEHGVRQRPRIAREPFQSGSPVRRWSGCSPEFQISPRVIEGARSTTSRQL